MVVIRGSVGWQVDGSVRVLDIMAMGEVMGDLGDEMERWMVGNMVDNLETERGLIKGRQ